MCQAIAEGGRRCFIHRRDSLAVVNDVAESLGVHHSIVEDVFQGLHRAARGTLLRQSGRRESSVDVLSAYTSRAAAEGRVFSIPDANLDSSPTPELTFAFSRLYGAVKNQRDNIQTQLGLIASVRGQTQSEVWDEFNTKRQNPNTSFWSAENQTYAASLGLPTDKASVCAFFEINSNITTPSQETPVEAVVTREDWSNRSRNLAEVGYADGRLEVVFSSSPERVYVYENVPDSVWEQLQDSSSPTRFLTQNVTRNPDYETTREQREYGGTRTQCADCGQFAAATHQCPERITTTTPLPQEPSSVVEEVEEELETGELVLPAVEQVQETHETLEPESSSDTIEVNENETEEYPELHTSLNHLYGTELNGGTVIPNIYNRLLFKAWDGALTQEEIEQYLSVSTDTAVNEINRWRRSHTVLARANVPSGWSSPVKLSSFDPDRSYGHYARLSPEDQERILRWKNAVANNPNVAPYVIIADNRIAGLTVGSDMVYTTVQTDGLVCGEGRGVVNLAVQDDDEASRHLMYPEDRLAQHEEQINVLTNQELYAQVETISTRKKIDDMVKVTPLRAASWRNQINGDLPLVSEVTFDVKDYHSRSSAVFPVTGMMQVVRGEDGTIRTTLNPRTLKCSCDRYRRQYYCSHVRRVNAVAQNTDLREILGLPENTQIEREGPVRRERVRSTITGATIPASFLSRQIVERVEDSDGSASIRLNVPSTRRGRLDINQQVAAPVENLDVTVQDITATFNANSSLGDITSWASGIRNQRAQASTGTFMVASMADPAVVSQALSYGEPVTVTLNDVRRRWGGGGVTGEVVLQEQEDQTVRVVSERLRCSCGRFTANQEPCPHIQDVQSSLAMGTGRVADLLPTSIRDRFESTEPVSVSGSPDELADPALIEQALLIEEKIRNLTQLKNSSPVTWSELEAQMPELARLSDSPTLGDFAEIVGSDGTINDLRQKVVAYGTDIDQRLNGIRAAKRSKHAEILAKKVEEYREYADSVTPARRDVLKQYTATIKDRWGGVGNFDLTDEEVENLIRDASRRTVRSQAGAGVLEVKQSVTNGVCDPSVPGHRKFGIELEYTLEGNASRNAAEVRRKIAQELYEIGLSTSSSAHGYHGSSRQGWNSFHIEADTTVAGELVTPLMDDSPESWEMIGQALEIIKRNGGVPSKDAGAHVNISTESYYNHNHVPETEVLREFTRFEDYLYRAASNPKEGRHRGTYWAKPLSYAADSSRDGAESTVEGSAGQSYRRYLQPAYHENAVNTQHYDAESGSRVEWRLFDSSLDLATIQHQVSVAAHMTEAAQQRVAETGKAEALNLDESRLKGHYARRGDENTDGDMIAGLTKFVKRNFPTKESATDFIKLFAVNKFS